MFQANFIIVALLIWQTRCIYLKEKNLFFVFMVFSLVFYGILIGKYKAPLYLFFKFFQDFVTKKYSKEIQNINEKVLGDQLKNI